jgi:spore germination protein GerM
MIGVKMAKKRASLGCLFWLALVLLVLVIFLFNQKNIETVLNKTGFMDLLRKTERPLEVTVDPSQPEKNPEEQSPPEQAPDEVVIEIEKQNPSEREEDPQPEEKTTDKPGEPSEEKRLRKARLYFVAVGTDGEIELKSVIRSVYFDNSPLRETLTALLEGPTSQEINQGLLNIIPEGTALRNVYIRGNTAVLDFSEDFRFNSIGQVGLKAQLKQVVYTATEFSNVYAVQILIEGKKQRFLSPEGLSIQDPLSRDSLRS